jgi:hypothetical protein
MVDGVSIAGTAIGSVSLFAQLVDGCIQAFASWQRGKEIGTDAVAFQVRMEMQAAKLKEWALGWGITKGAKPLHVLEPRFKKYGDLAVQYVATINHLLGILDGLATDHPAIASGSNFPVSAASHIARLDDFADSSSGGRKAFAEKIDSIRDDANMIEKLNWRTDEARASKALDLIKIMIDDLYAFFQPPKNDGTAHIVLNACLASMNLNQLEKMKETCDEDPLLRGLAYLKTASDRLEKRGNALEYLNIKRKYRHLKEIRSEDGRNSRSWGSFECRPVMVEWKIVPAASVASPESLVRNVVLERRIENVARLLQSGLKPKELRTLSCLGVVTRSDPQSANNQYGLLFEIPSLHSRTLLSVFNDETVEFTLGSLFSIAKNLSEALLFLHLAGWLHKGIRSDNILFFGPDHSSPDLEEPSIVGFEYSRESQANAMTEGVFDDLEFNLYRHPEVQGVPEEPLEALAQRTSRPPFSQAHDIYSLGVVLIEIGMMKSALRIMSDAEADPAYGPHSAARFSAWLIEKELPKLSRRMGKTYREAAEFCITGKFVGDETSPETGFYLNVVRPLADCRL